MQHENDETQSVSISVNKEIDELVSGLDNKDCTRIDSNDDSIGKVLSRKPCHMRVDDEETGKMIE